MAIGLLVLPEGVARAQSGDVANPVVVFDSFGAGNSYLTTVVWAVSGASTSGGYRGQAEWFVPGISGNLSSITLATLRISGSGRSNFFIAEDNNGVPGAILESYGNVLNTASGLLTLNSSSQPMLQAGLTYWVCDEPADATSLTGWFQNNQSRTNGFAFERSPWSWQGITSHAPPSGVMRVSLVPIPEPGIAALMSVALGLIVASRKGLNR